MESAARIASENDRKLAVFKESKEAHKKHAEDIVRTTANEAGEANKASAEAREKISHEKKLAEEKQKA